MFGAKRSLTHTHTHGEMWTVYIDIDIYIIYMLHDSLRPWCDINIHKLHIWLWKRVRSLCPWGSIAATQQAITDLRTSQPGREALNELPQVAFGPNWDKAGRLGGWAAGMGSEDGWRWKICKIYENCNILKPGDFGIPYFQTNPSGDGWNIPKKTVQTKYQKTSVSIDLGREHPFRIVAWQIWRWLGWRLRSKQETEQF